MRCNREGRHYTRRHNMSMMSSSASKENNKDGSACLSDCRSQEQARSFFKHENLFQTSETNVFREYMIVKELGKGSIGDIYMVRMKKDCSSTSSVRSMLRGLSLRRPQKESNTKQKRSSSKKCCSAFFYALKTIQQDRVRPEFLQELHNEVNILTTLDHPNIVKIHEMYTNRRNIYLIMQLCSGGDLYSREPYSESQAAHVVTKILSAVRYLHERDICHRDLKFENIMFESLAEDAEIKLIDFGLSKRFGQQKRMTERVGTVETMSPQVLKGDYSVRADMWSVGVVTYMLLSSKRPFYHHRRRVMVDNIMNAKHSFRGKVWDTISSDAKDFVKKLLIRKCHSRMTAEQAAQHPWIISQQQEQCSLSNNNSERDADALLADIKNGLIRYQQAPTLKKIALAMIALRSSPSEIAEIRQAFNRFDSDRDGVISYKEFKNTLNNDSEYSDETIKDIFDSIDIHHTGDIHYIEFLSAAIDATGRIDGDRIAEAFHRLDKDKSGRITKKNLQQIMGDDCTSEQIEEVMNGASDSGISFQEFASAFKQTDTK